MQPLEEWTRRLASRKQKSGLIGRSSKEANREGSQSGKAMRDAAPPCGTSKEMSRQTEEDRLQGYVPLWLIEVMHSDLQITQHTPREAFRACKVVVNSSDIVDVQRAASVLADRAVQEKLVSGYKP